MKLVVGLGNPGNKYEHNRHNVGFLFLDWLVIAIDQGKIQNAKLKMQNDNSIFKIDKYSEAETCEIMVEDEELILIKPQTFMNNSGKSVKSLTTNYQLPTTDISVIHDDLDIRLGQYKIQNGKGPKLHNGIESIENAIGTKDFWRVRIGVDNRTSENRVPGESYVLQNFTPDELESLQNTFEKILPEMLNLLHD